jgi:hypothetical protein
VHWSFLNIRNAENQQSLQGFHIALDDEGILLLQLLLQLLFERRQELSRCLRVGRQQAVDHHGITIGEARHRPKVFVELGIEGEAAKLSTELLQGLKFQRFNRPTYELRGKPLTAYRRRQRRKGQR